LLWSFCAFYKYDELKPNIMYEKLTMVATMLFILSMISERVVTFFKLWCVEGNSFLFFIVPKALDTSKKYEDATLENKRQRAILSINLTISFFIALISNASLFKMFTYDSETDVNFLLGWDFASLDLHAFGSMLVGCALTACFISLGSKFWHDMLDMLFYAKNLKEKLVDKATYEMNSIKKIDEWINLSEDKIISKLYEENKDSLKNIPNVIAVGLGQEKGGYYIEVVTTKANREIPAFLTYNLPNNKIKNYPIKVIISSPIVTHGNLNFKSDITNQDRLSNFGSFGIGVKFKGSEGNRKMLLTCYHVIIGNGDDFFNFKYTKNDKIVSPHDNEDAIIGNVLNAIRNDTIDAALIEVENNIFISNDLPDNGGSITSTRIIQNDEPYNNIPVRIYGYINNSTGKITSINNDANIVYTLPDGSKQNWEIKDLIAVSDFGSPISQEGDSGSALLDDQNNVIGIVVAGNDTTTYVIPIETIFSQLNIELL